MGMRLVMMETAKDMQCFVNEVLRKLCKFKDSFLCRVFFY